MDKHVVSEKPFSLEFIYNVFNLAPIGIVIANDQGVIEDANQYLCDAVQYSKEELLGQKVEVLVPERIRGQHVGMREGYIKNPSNRMMGQNRELFCVTKSGAEIPVEVGLSTVSEHGDMKIVVTVADVTVKRESDRKLRAISLELEEVSTPILEVWEKIAVVPIIGTLDSDRSMKLMENTLIRMKESRYHVTILDITGLTGIDTSIANHLLRLASAIRLMGGVAMITGVSPEIAKTIVRLGVNLGELRTSASLANGLKNAISLLERQDLL